MSIETKDFSTLVSDQVTAIQSKMSNIQFPIGSIELSLVESNAGVALWLQGIVIQLVALTRSGSCNGADLDSFFNIFGFFRNGSVASSGLVTFSRNTSTNQALVPVASLVQTQPPSVQFQVYADTSNPNYNQSLNAYVLAPTVASIDVPVQCLIQGTLGNVNAGAINQIASSIVGIDNVDNSAPFTNGRDQESDNDYRNRFIPYINSLSLGTILAYETAITNGTPSIFYNILENTNISNNPQPGFNSIIIDDGSGNPPTSLIQLITTKINLVRAAGIQIGVYAVSPLTANFSFTLTLNPLYPQLPIIASVKNSIGLYIASLQIGQKVIATKIYQLIYESSAGIIEASNLLINGSSSDLIVAFNERAFVGTYNITVT